MPATTRDIHEGSVRAGRRPVRARLAVALIALAVAAGCGTGTPGTAAGDGPGPVPSSAAPVPTAVLDGLTVALAQSRSDWADRVVQVDVTDDGSTAVEVVEASLTSTAFAGTATSERGRTVRPGTTRSLSVALGVPVCGPEPVTGTGPVAATVTLLLADEQGRRSTVTVVPSDERGHLARIHGEDCAADAVSRGAVLGIDDAFSSRWVDGRLVGSLVLRLRPVADGPVVEVTAIDGTVLLAPEGGGASWVPVGLGADGSAPGDRTATLTFGPARCDAHAVAEDKRGTYLGVHATVDGVAVPVFYLAVTDRVRAQIHEYLGQSCGWE